VNMVNCYNKNNDYYIDFRQLLEEDEFAYYDEIVIPIQSCEGKWCKIYYPCGQKEYFVKKDNIVKRKY